MSLDIKVAATGIIALCLALSALLYISSAADQGLQGTGDKFFALAAILILIVVVLAIAGIKVKLP
jgi:hypothetical protein